MTDKTAKLSVVEPMRSEQDALRADILDTLDRARELVCDESLPVTGLVVIVERPGEFTHFAPSRASISKLVGMLTRVAHAIMNSAG